MEVFIVVSTEMTLGCHLKDEPVQISNKYIIFFGDKIVRAQKQREN